MQTILLLAALTIHRDPFHFVEKSKPKVVKKAPQPAPVVTPVVAIVEPPKPAEEPPKPVTWHSIGGIGSTGTSLVVVKDNGDIINVDVGRTLLSALRATR